MSFLADIHSYWSSNSTLNGAIPASKVYTGLIPETKQYPYAVIVPIAMVPTPLTGNAYFETFTFQISIYDTDPDTVESLTNTIGGQFDFQSVASGYMLAERSSGPVFFVDPDTPQRVYHAVLTYDLRGNRTLPAVG